MMQKPCISIMQMPGRSGHCDRIRPLRAIWHAALICLAATSPVMAQEQVRFTDLSDRLPPHVYDGGWEHFVGGGVAVFDCDADDLPDIFAAGGSNPATLLRNRGGFDFEAAPVPPISDTVGAYPIDIDGDSRLDLYVLRVGPDVVLQGGPNCSFADATARWGIPQGDQWSTAFTAWWQDDQRPVMAVGHYVDRANPDGPFFACDTNSIFRPTQDGYRQDILQPGFCALSMLAGPDARGRLSLRISNDRQYYVRGGSEQLYDIADQRFLGPEDGWPTVSLWGMGIASADLTGDGRDEVMLTSMGDQLLQIAQENGSYTAAPYDTGTSAHIPHTGTDGRPATGWHAQFADVNNDGRMDLFIAKGNVDQMPSNAMEDPNNLLIQNEDGKFTEAASSAGVADTARSRGAALADFDGDGRLDLVVLNRRAPLRIYRNDTPGGDWLALRLSQPGGNSQAIGASVRIGDQVQHLRIGGGHASGQSTPLHFGLGAAQGAAQTVDVTWPDGSQSTFTTTPNQLITLTKP